MGGLARARIQRLDGYDPCLIVSSKDTRGQIIMIEMEEMRHHRPQHPSLRNCLFSFLDQVKTLAKIPNSRHPCMIHFDRRHGTVFTVSFLFHWKISRETRATALQDLL
jgi:hypothetical protein